LDKKGYTGQSAALAARLCGGNVNTALSILSDEGYFKRRQDYMALCNALSGNSAQKILKDLTALADPGGFLAFAEGYFRDALVYHVTGDAERVAHSDALGHFKTMGEKRAAALLDRVRQARIILAANGNFKLLAAELIREGGLQSWQKS